MNAISQSETGSSVLSGSDGMAPQGVELRHLRYFVAVADAGTFTHAAERMYIAQPTLSQQIRRLEEMVGTPLLRRRREGVRLTEAGMVLLEESRTVLSLIDHGVSRTRQAAGIGRPRLRFVVPPHLPEMLMVETASRLRSTALGADVDVAWIEIPLDGEFSAIQQRRADAGLGWMNQASDAFPAHLEVMNLGKFEPVAWIPAGHPAAPYGTIELGELAQMDVVHGPRRLSTGTYDAWLAVLRLANPRFEFTDPPFRNSLPMTLAFAATGRRPTAVLTGPCYRMGAGYAQADRHPATSAYGMVPVHVDQHPLAAAAGLVWNVDLPRQLQQVLVDTAMAAFSED
jgi:DNA-binding transcriptional LysR family regulator